MMPMTTSSGTSAPASMWRLASRPISGALAHRGAEHVPVEMCGSPKRAHDALRLRALARAGGAEEDDVEL